jgi:hypothetical protein
MTTDTGTDSGTYFNAAKSLKRSLIRNREDALFCEKPKHEIVYVFDTNVFVFHANLKDDYPLNRNFNALVGDETSSPVSRAIERLTANFIFSGQLPGQQRGRGFISVQHFEEVMIQADKISKALSRAPNREMSNFRVEAVSAQVKAILDGEATIETKLRELATIVPAAWVESLTPAVQFSSAMRAAFLSDPQRLTPLDREPWGWDASQVTSADVDFWREALRPPSKHSEMLTRDAETLATMVNLYRNDEESRGDRRTRLYLFVSGDDSIARAVREKGPELRHLGVPNFVRLPQDYLPLLNLSAMREALAPAGFSEKMRNEFKTVFDTLASALEWVDIAVADGTDFSELFRKTGALGAVQQCWQAISQYVTVLNAYHFVRDTKQIFGELGDLMASSEGAIAAADRVRDTVLEVRDGHLAIVIQSAIAAIARDSGNRQGPRHMRAQIKLIGDLFGSLLPQGMSIGVLLDNAIRDGKLAPETFDILRRIPKKLESRLLTTCLFVAAERWRSAEQVAEYAVELTRKRSIGRPEVTEAAYLHALCLRFGMRRRTDYERARRHLEGNLRAYRQQQGNPLAFLRRIRDEIELGSLMQTAAIMQGISTHQSKGPARGRALDLLGTKRPATAIFESARRIREALDGLLDAEPFEFPRRGLSQEDGSALIASLKGQATANLLAAYIFERLVPGLQAEALAVPDATDLLHEMAERTLSLRQSGHEPRTTPWLYQCVATALHTTDLDVANRAADEAAKLIDGIDLAGSGIPPMDVLEFGFLKGWLADRKITTAAGEDTDKSTAA